MIRTVIKFENNMVMAFDEEGEQIPEYQGRCEDVEERVLKDAPADAVFAHGFSDVSELRKVLREEW